MVALFLCMLFAFNVSFAQDSWETVAVYMEDPVPIEEQLAPKARDYLYRLNDPFTWETEQDFEEAREAQKVQLEQNNEKRIRAVEALLKADISLRGDGTSSWYPAWIPLGSASTWEDSLFKNALYLRGNQNQSLIEFFEQDGWEPHEGTGEFRPCDDARRRCRKEFYAHFRELVEIYLASLIDISPGPNHPYNQQPEVAIINDDPNDDPTFLRLPALISPSLSLRLPALIWPSLIYPDTLNYQSPLTHSHRISPLATSRIISFTIKAASTRGPGSESDAGFVNELNEEGEQAEGQKVTTFDWSSIRLLQEATISPDTLSFHVWPAAKPVSSTETSSWGHIKETFAD